MDPSPGSGGMARSGRAGRFKTLFLPVLFLVLARPLAGSPYWVSGERLADLLMYHHLMDGVQYDQAGQVLDRLLAAGRRTAHVRVLEAGYCLEMHDLGRTGNWLARAGDAARAAVRLDPAGWRGYFLLSRWNEISGNVQEALHCARQALDKEDVPRDVWASAIELARKHGTRGDLGQLLEAASERGYLDGNGLYALGMIRLSEGRLQDAISCLESVREYGDSGLGVRASNALLVLYRERLDFRKVGLMLDQLQKLFPGDVVYRQHRVILDFLRDGIPRQPVSLEGLHPESVKQSEHLAVLLLVSGDTNGARRIAGLQDDSPGYVGAAVRFHLDPVPERRASLALALAGRAMQEGMTDLAEQWLTRGSTFLPVGESMTNADWLTLQARLALAQKEYVRAAEYATLLVRSRPADNEARSLLAAACVQLDRHEEAIRLFTAAGDGDGLVGAALTRARRGQPEVALRYTETLLRQAPLHGEAARLHALSLEQLSRTNDALRALETWYGHGGRDAATVAVYARLEIGRGEGQRALRLIDEAASRNTEVRSGVSLAVRGERAELGLLRAQALSLLKRYRQVVAVCEDVLALGGLPTERLVELHLCQGQAFLATGRTKSALAAWRRIQVLVPGEKRSLQMIKEHEAVDQRSVRWR
ncbi:MAG TPA: tetratricopeptide repeat protein [Spirochaetota bacterium]|nr:tetratricopeptide repeat protein [Spirochaetota bacterium]